MISGGIELIRLILEAKFGEDPLAQQMFFLSFVIYTSCNMSKECNQIC